MSATVLDRATGKAIFSRSFNGTGHRYQAETVAVRSGVTSTLDITIQPGRQSSAR